jgi:hypothetical protein
VGEAEYWRGKARQLEGELLGVNEELMGQLRKAERSEDLEEKIELLLAQNTHFVDENENLIRLVQQKNGEIEGWKRKFDSQHSHSSLAEAEKRKVYDHLNLKDQEHQIQFDKLVAEVTPPPTRSPASRTKPQTPTTTANSNSTGSKTSTRATHSHRSRTSDAPRTATRRYRNSTSASSRTPLRRRTSKSRIWADRSVSRTRNSRLK